MIPQRLQRKRTKGWRKPAGAVIVDRTSRWGNPFQIEKLPTRLFPGGWWIIRDVNSRVSIPMELRVLDDMYLAAVVATRLFALHTGPMGSYEYDPDTLARLRRDLGGRHLLCPCEPGQPCHGDVLLRRANPEITFPDPYDPEEE